VFATYKWLRPASDSAATSGATGSLAILPFGNATGDQSLDSLGLAIADMVRSQLGQSDRLQLVASDRIHQILRDLRITTVTDDQGMLRRIADFTNADAIVAGRYFKVGNQIRLAAAIYDPRRNTPVSVSAEAPSENELLTAVSELTRSIRSNLALSSSVVKELETHVLKPSSQSVQALRLYSEGMELLRSGSNQAAIQRFEGAAAADPNFALAYSRLGQTYQALGFGRDAEKHSTRAVSLSDRLPTEERYIVLGTHARITGDVDKAIDAYQNLAKALPGDTQVQF
jgi:tetratricopeptide (TPR) repeat protein